jgi:predicted Fe-Mo cluster-binding NifX family protein
MILCIPVTDAAQGESLDTRFGRAATLCFIDTEAGGRRTVPNTQTLQAAQGAGIQTAQRAIDEGAEAVVAANIGPKAFRVLSAAGVRVYTAASGTVEDLVSQLQAGKLPEADGATVEGHWV